jgi:putative nucleotidyltransferase with HDIG domain
MTFTLSLLSAMGIKDQQLLKEAGAGALLHDIGKAKVPLKILNKAGPLNEEEWQIMKKHPVYGFAMLDQSPVPERGRNIVVQHHEKITGIGYPYGLKGEQIPIIAQAVSLCDAYDAMTTNRCYQKAMKPFDAFMIITNEMKGHFDPPLVEKFIRILNLKK